MHLYNLTGTKNSITQQFMLILYSYRILMKEEYTITHDCDANLGYAAYNISILAIEELPFPHLIIHYNLYII